MSESVHKVSSGRLAPRCAPPAPVATSMTTDSCSASRPPAPASGSAADHPRPPRGPGTGQRRTGLAGGRAPRRRRQPGGGADGRRPPPRPGADLRAGGAGVLRGEAGGLADGEPRAQLADRDGSARPAEAGRDAGGPGGHGGVRGAAPAGARRQARDGEGGGCVDHRRSGLGADPGAQDGRVAGGDGAAEPAEAGGGAEASRGPVLVGGGASAGADRRDEVRTPDEAGDPVHGADCGKAGGGSGGDVGPVRP